MGLISSLKKIKLSKIVKTVKKTVGDATKIASGVATGGIAGGLSEVSALKKGGSIPDSTIYGSAEAATAARTTNSVLGTGDATDPSIADKNKSQTTTLLIAGGALLAFVLLSRKR